MSNTNNDKARELIDFQVRRQITSLFKEYLCILEELRDDNLFSDEYYQKLRKKILSRANDGLRELEEFIDKFEIN
ncbi:MAG: hypothetical protein Q8O88_04945, partial [bacterium]|nr:hypothetical protein [bacterium]